MTRMVTGGRSDGHDQPRPHRDEAWGPTARLEIFGTLYMRAIREAFRVRVSAILVPLVLPVFMLIIFARVFATIVVVPGFGGAGNYAGYILPAVILMGVMLGSPTAGISAAMELQTGFFDRLRLSPKGERRSMLARRLADATRLAGFTVTLFVVGAADGVSVVNWWLALAIGSVLCVWWGIAYGALSLGACIRTRGAEASQALVPLFFPLLFMSSAFVPTSVLPPWLQVVSTVNPLSYISEACRMAMAGTTDWTSIGISVACLVAVSVLGEVWIRRSLVASVRTY